VDQAEETGVYLSKELETLARQGRLRVYSSLFYRCLQTLKPTIERLRRDVDPDLKVRGERGFSEWFGKAWFEQPIPADPSRLKRQFFPYLDDQYESKLIPDRHGEHILKIHDRIAVAFHRVIKDIDEEYEAAGRGSDEVTLLICGHAAQIICSGRVLTGNMPDDPDEDDFQCFTCGLSKFRRRQITSSDNNEEHWRGMGIAGGWDCILNSWCGHLSGGEERGWHFHGDESFDSYGPGHNQGPIVSDGGLHDGSAPAAKL